MTQFCDLYGDILRKIAVYLNPWDFRAFRLTNKHVYEHLNVEFYKKYVCDNTEIVTEFEPYDDYRNIHSIVKLTDGKIYRYQAEHSFSRDIYIDYEGNKFWHIRGKYHPYYYTKDMRNCDDCNIQSHLCGDEYRTGNYINRAYIYYDNDNNYNYFIIGILHRLNGPAVEWKNGSADWFEYGICKSPLKKWTKNNRISCCCFQDEINNFI